MASRKERPETIAKRQEIQMANNEKDDIMGGVVPGKKRKRGTTPLPKPKNPTGPNPNMARPRDASRDEDPEGFNTRLINVNIQLMALPKASLYDAEQVKHNVSEYLRIYAENNVRPTIAGLALALKVNRRRLLEIKTGELRSGHVVQKYPPETVEIIRTALMINENMWEGYMLGMKVHPASGIFLGVNNFGYRNTSELQLANKPAEDTQISAAEIKARYQALDEPEALPEGTEESE